MGGIQPSQADYWQATRATGHGDFHILVFAPATIQEMVDLVYTAYDKADEYRMPAMILADGMLGQMMEPVEFPEKEAERKIEKPWATTGHQNKRVHNITNSLYLDPNELEQKVVERFKRYEIIKEKEPMAEEYLVEDADIVLVSFGATARIVKSAVNSARAMGIKAGMIRPITLWPFPEKAMQKAAKTASCFLSVEMSMGQMVDDVRLAVNGEKPVYFFGRTGGIIPSPAEVLGEIQKIMGGAK